LKKVAINEGLQDYTGESGVYDYYLSYAYIQYLEEQLLNYNDQLVLYTGWKEKTETAATALKTTIDNAFKE
jgi:hypothetical protein